MSTRSSVPTLSEVTLPMAETYFWRCSDLTNTVALIRSRLDRGVELRFLPTKIDGRVKVSAEILSAVRSGLQDRVLPVVRTDANLVRAPMVKTPVVFAFPSSKGAKDYGRLAEEVLATSG